VSEPIKRKLIEVALPLEAINVASAIEKRIHHGHPSTLHLWWARRPLAACRAVLFASIVDDPSSNPGRFPTAKSVAEERTRLFGIIERLVRWENTTNEAVLEEARTEIRRSTGGNPPPVLDPFCGGGSIPLEAQRLGLTAYGSDLNPIAVLITKGLIEIPPTFADRAPVHPDARRGVGGTGVWTGAGGLAEDVRRYGAWMRDEAERRLGNIYPKVRLPKEYGGSEATVIAWLWARTVTCPNPACGAGAPLVNDWLISNRRASRWFVRPIVDRQRKAVSFAVETGATQVTSPTIGRAGGRCIVCNQAFPLSHVRAEGMAGRLTATMLAIVADGPLGRIYVAPTPEHTSTASTEAPTGLLTTPLPEAALGFRVQGYGITEHRQLFTNRQLLLLDELARLAPLAGDRAQSDAVALTDGDEGSRLNAGGRGPIAYGEAITAYLTLGLGRVANRSSSQSFWDAGGEKVQQVFARNALPMIWVFAEANPFSDSSGSIKGQIDYLAEALSRVPATPAATVTQQDAANLRGEPAMALVSTDPPYYDNVPYADLSDFFYVWERGPGAAVYPELFSTLLVPKTQELIAEPARHGGRTAAGRFFEHGLSSAFRALRARQDPIYPMSIFYAFKQAEDGAGELGEEHGVASTGWATMLEAILGAGLQTVGTWPVRTEQSGGLREVGRNALASSIVVVCRLRPTEAGITTRKDMITALKREMPEALRTLQHGNVAPVDLAQASIGPGMAVFSRYSEVLEPDGSAMSVRTALALINQVLDEILSEQEGEFDADTRWAIAWFEQFGLKEGEYGFAETLSKAKNSSVAGLVEAGIVAAARGRVRLLARSELSVGWDPAKDKRIPVWEATQRLVHSLLASGEAAAADLLVRLGGLGDSARDLAYRMYNVAERKGWSDEARAYNALVVAWTDLSRGAESARVGQPTQAELGLE
jgi:putative DNA methylase